MSEKALGSSPCPLCGYPTASSPGEKALRGATALSQCTNRLCPERPACPACGSQAIHSVRITGEMRCRCGGAFYPGT